MIAYFLGAILLVGIPFLLYCLWNVARELKPRRSNIVVSQSSIVSRSRAVPTSGFRTHNQVIQLQEPRRSAS